MFSAAEQYLQRLGVTVHKSALVSEFVDNSDGSTCIRTASGHELFADR